MNNDSKDYIIIAGGCFWGMEDLFSSFKGVIDTEVGYSGGNFDNPTYNDVRTGKTGHAESLKVVYDKNQTNLEDILRFFFKIHDPTTPNRQGGDVGTQYRSAVFYKNEEIKETINKIIDETNNLGRFKDPVTTLLEPEGPFYSAEEYHQDYIKKNPNGYSCHFIRD